MSNNAVEDFLGMQVTQFTHAVCRRVDLNIMHPADEKASNRVQKGLCIGCVHKSDCLELAIATKAEGIWGGTTTRERKEIIERRQSDGESVPNAGVKLVVGRPRHQKRIGLAHE